ncbi:hypothetical protein [Photorhabdus laumondii]|uniref:hypothetical protein n=1 Tax=Photorhabdus laumondii TaxID=2218628 RepID=UPI0025B01373|nr:hypothetical protein [Photorhabdus laumondii]
MIQQHSRLSDALGVIVRELGLSSWVKLKAHVDALEQVRMASQIQNLAPDHELAILHILLRMVFN